MKITYTLYPRFQPPVEMQILYVPKLDQQPTEGYWNIDTNQIAIGYPSLQAKKTSFFQQKQAKKPLVFRADVRTFKQA